MASDLFLKCKEEENDKIEKCLKEIESYLKNLKTKPEKKTPKISNKVQGKALHILLKEMLYTVQDHGLEELLLPHLEEFKKQNDLSYLTSINSIYEEHDLQAISEEEKVNFLWEMMTFHIITYIKKKLKSIHLNYHLSQYGNFHKYLICYYLRNLSGLITASQIWELHQSIRLNILEELKCICPSKNKELCLQCLLITSTYYILEDKELICNGYFQPLVITWTEITKIYIQFISEKYIKLLKNINQIREINESNWLSYLSMQCFMKAVPSCQLQYENKFLNNTKRICPIIFKSKAHKDLEEYLKNNSSNKNNIICHLLLNIIKMMYNFEDKILSVCIGGIYKTRIICYHSNANECTSQGIPLMVPNDSPEQSPIHIQLSDDNENLPFNWNWRYIFQDLGLLTFIQRCFQDQMQNHIQFCLTKEWKLISLYKRISSVYIEIVLHNNKRVIQIIFSVACVIGELDKFSPLISSSRGAFLPFQATFSHILHTYVIELLSHIEKISSIIPYKLSIENLYILLTSTTCLKEKLISYANEMNYIKEKSRNDTTTLALQEKIDKLEDLLLQKVLNYQIKLLLSGVLQDADSHNWSGHKSFFEGNRISFSVQMWNLYMMSIIHDVKQYLPAKLACNIILNILCESLNHLTSRYIKAVPSKARINQFCNDIITILLCTTEYLPYICSSEIQLLGNNCHPFHSDSNVSLIDSIHNYSYMLLIVIAIVASPLPILYKVFKKGLPELSISCQKVIFIPWLSWIQPAMYAYIGQGKLMSSSSVWLNVKLSVSQIEPEPYLIIKAFSCHECTLAILFMTQVNEESISYHEDSLSSSLKNNNDLKFKLSRSIFSILQFCYHQPNGLANVLLPVIERSNGWKEFDKSTICLPNYQRSWWYQGLMELFYPLVKSTLISSLPKIMEKNKIKLIDVSKSKWKELGDAMSCSFECNCENFFYEEDENKIEIECALHILMSFKEQVISLPVTVIKCLSILETQLQFSKQNIMPICNSLLIQIFLSGLSIVLKELRYLEELIEAYSIEAFKDIIDKVFEVLIDLLSENISKLKFHKQYLDLVTDFTDYIKTVFERNSEKANQAVNNAIQEFEDDCLEISTTEFLQYRNGEDHIHYLYHLLKINLLWIQTSLGIPDILNTDSVLNSISPSPFPFEDYKDIKDEKKLNNNFKSIQNMQELISNKYQCTSSHLPGAVVEDSVDDMQCQSYINMDNIQNHRIYEKNIINHLKEISESKTVGDRKNQLRLDANFLSINNKVFNPLLYFNRIGNSTNILDQEIYKKFSLPWEPLLDHISLFGLTEDGLKTLLMHRWEFIGKDSLPSGQEKYIHLLKSQYGLDEEDGDCDDSDDITNKCNY